MYHSCIGRNLISAAMAGCSGRRSDLRGHRRSAAHGWPDRSPGRLGAVQRTHRARGHRRHRQSIAAPAPRHLSNRSAGEMSNVCSSRRRGAPPITGRERAGSRSRPASPERATHVRTARASEHPGAGPGFHTFPRGRSARLLSGPPRQPVDQCHQPRAAGGTRQCAWRTRSPVAGQPVTAARGKVLGAPPRGQPRRHEISGPAPPAAGPGRGG